MISEKWEQIKEHFETAVEQDLSTRTAFLSQLSQEDPLIAEQVVALISSYEKAGDFLNQPFSLDSGFFEDFEVDQPHFSKGDILCARFNIVQLLGKGGMGEVYKAWDEEFEAFVALKVLRPEVATNDSFAVRFRREIQLARKVTHLNVCRIFDGFRHKYADGTYITILSMELLQGQTLAQYLQAKGRLTADEALPLVIQAVHGINAVHEAGIVHRDLKPSNLILVPDTAGYLLKITDFGIAGHLSAGQSHISLTGNGGILGTPDYMAPEQLQHGRTSVQSDIYALGLILYEMVTGAKPFSESSAWSRIDQDPYPPKKLASDLPARWEKVIRCCLERLPKYRFRQVQEIADTLVQGAARSIPQKPLLVRLEAITRSRMGISATIFSLILALSVTVLRYSNQSMEIPRGSKVLITEIQNQTENSIFSGITTVLKGQLDQSSYFETEGGDDTTWINADQTQDSPVDAASARSTAKARGDSLIVFGTLSKLDKRFVLSISLERSAQGRSSPTRRWQRNFSAKSAQQILENVRVAASWIRIIAGESPQELALQDRPAEDTTTISWHAVQLLTEANRKQQQGDSEAALLLLHDALVEDPHFALAHMRVADILISKKRYQEGYVEWEKAIESSDQRELTSRENLRIKGQYYEDTWNYKKEEETYHSFVIHYPNDYLSWFLWGSALDALDRKEEAIQAFLKASEKNPSWYGIHEHLAILYLLLEKLEEAEFEISTVKRLGNAESAAWLEANRDFLQGSFSKALDELAILNSSSDRDWKSRGFLYKANFLAELGKLDEALQVLAEGSAFDEVRQDRPAQAEKQLAAAYLFLRQADFRRCAEASNRAASLNPSARILMEAGALFARIGYVHRAKKIHQILRLQQQIPLSEMAVRRLEGEIALAEKNKSAAVKSLTDAARLAKPREQKEYLARAFLSTGNIPEAKKILSDIVTQPVRWFVYPNSYWPGISRDSLLEYLELSSDSTDSGCSLMSKFPALNRQANPAQQSIFNRYSQLCINKSL